MSMKSMRVSNFANNGSMRGDGAKTTRLTLLFSMRKSSFRDYPRSLSCTNESTLSNLPKPSHTLPRKKLKKNSIKIY
jgi:hypothetical protein